MTLTPLEIDALVGAVVALLNGLAIYLAKQSSSKRHARTQAQLTALHRALTAPRSVGDNGPPNQYVAPLVDGHNVPPRT